VASDNLKSKLRRPLLILIVVFPLITLILFNIAVRIYVDRNARAELLGVSKMMETSIRTELARDLGDFSAIGINNAFTRLAKSLSASKLAVNTEMLLFNRQQELLYPQDESAQALSRQLIDKVSNRLPSLQEKRVYTLRDGRSKYFLLAYPLTNLARGNPTVVFISQTDKATALINTINLILIILLVLGAALAALLAERLSARIARPVVKLSELTKQIGSGHFSFPAQPAAVTDISEINMLYQSIGEMAKRLEAYDNSQKTFLQNASHELKTPLMSIQGYAEGIAGGVLPDTKQAG
jgi:HAMP domain-containing protein